MAHDATAQLENDHDAAPPALVIAPDCRHYRGDRPCPQNRLCGGCGHYEPYGHRVCVIKLAALGDVIRTLCVLPGVRQRYPDAHITWVSLPGACRLLREHALIDRVLTFDALQALRLEQERFDLVISLDKEAEPAALAMAMSAKRKMGIGLSPQGTPIPLNPEAESYFALGLSDEMKFRRNRKSYPQLIYEALGWPYGGEQYELRVQPARQHAVRQKLCALGWRPQHPTLGINVGAANTYANKMWPAQRIADLVERLRLGQVVPQVLLLGGAAERPVVDSILKHLAAHNAINGVIDAGTDHDEPTFVATVDTCDALFCGDTMAMHVANALAKGLIAVFGPTCEQEVQFFGQGLKLVAHVPCAPCYKRVCDHGDACIHQTSIGDAIGAIRNVLARCTGAAQPAAPPQTRAA